MFNAEANNEYMRRVSAGDMTAAGKLYESNKGLIARVARRYASIDVAVSPEDLTQTAFISTVQAAQSYNANEGMTWASWLTLHLTGSFRTLCGINSKHRRAHVGTVSLDEPISDGDGGEASTRLEMLEDQTSDSIDAGLLNAERRRAIMEALDRLPADQREAITLHDVQRFTHAAAAARMGYNVGDFRSLRERALKALRADKRLSKQLDERTNFYAGTGLRAFLHTWTSATEKAAIWRIEHSI